MKHARGHWVWLRVRCEAAFQSGEAGPHLIGIAVDVTEQKNLVEKTVAADIRLRDAIETIPRRSCCGMRRKPPRTLQQQVPAAT